MSGIEELREKFTVERPDSIREKVAAWAFEDAADAGEVVRRLESIDCAACYSPAPIYYHKMAAEFASHWSEIDDAVAEYRDSVGEAWTPRDGGSVLDYLWFAYEEIAHNLAGEISHAIEHGEEAETPRFRSPSAIAADARGNGYAQDNGIGPVPGEAGRVHYRTPAEIAAAARGGPEVPEHANDNGIER